MREVDGREMFLEYSTVVDAPVTYGMDEQAFRDHYLAEYGRSSMAELEERLARCRRNGGSSVYDPTTFEEAISCNRAGKDETELTADQFVNHYFRARSGDPPVGLVQRDDKEDGAEVRP